jgi:GNAT superfamily N-acetyltransferase
LLEQPDETYLLERSFEIVGLMKLGASRDTDLSGSNIGEIFAIYIAPERWRQGLGRLFVERAEQIFKERGCREVALWGFQDNNQARQFYKAMGYAADGAERIWKADVPLAIIRFRKRI